MNIFVLDRNIEKCVEYISDKHCAKMVLETAQILCSAFEPGVAPYKRTHYNHPCCVWARTSLQNYQWLIEYGEKLTFEHFWRFSPKRVHKSFDTISWCKENQERLDLPNIGLTEFAQALSVKWKDPVLAYRFYYLTEKKDLAVWKKKRTKPSWYSEETLNNLQKMLVKQCV